MLWKRSGRSNSEPLILLYCQSKRTYVAIHADFHWNMTLHDGALAHGHHTSGPPAILPTPTAVIEARLVYIKVQMHSKYHDVCEISTSIFAKSVSF